MELLKQGDKYTLGNLVLNPDPPEDVLVRLYYEWKKSGVMERVFYGQPTSLYWFLDWFGSKVPSVLGVYHNGEGFGCPIGLVWINTDFSLPCPTKPGGLLRAEVAMGFMRGQRPDLLADAGRMAIEWGFQFRKLDALIGTTPIQNRAAIAFGKRLGFDVVGPVHGMATWHGNLTDVYISSLTKCMWSRISPFSTASEEHVLESQQRSLPCPAIA